MCKEKKWTGKKRACFAEASNEEALTKCSRMDNERKEDEKAAAPAAPQTPGKDPGTGAAPGTVAP